MDCYTDFRKMKTSPDSISENPKIIWKL